MITDKHAKNVKALVGLLESSDMPVSEELRQLQFAAPSGGGRGRGGGAKRHGGGGGYGGGPPKRGRSDGTVKFI